MKRLIKTISSVALLGMILLSCSNKNAAAEEAKEVSDVEASIENEGVNDADPGYKIVDNAIISDNLPVVVDFYTDWCKPCQAYAPIFEAVSEQFAGQAVFVRINSEENPELAKTYDVQAIPTTVFIQTGGGVLGTRTGAMSQEELTGMVEQLVATAMGNGMEL